MRVLKKFGIVLSLLISVSIYSIAQQKENVIPNSKSTYKHLTPVEYVQQVALNPKAPVNAQNLLPAKKQDAQSQNVSADEILKSRTINRATTSVNQVQSTQTKEKEESFATHMLDWVKDKYASMIEVMPNQISNVMLYRFIDDWYGVKYRMGGTTKNGVDCSSFVQQLYQYVFGYDLLRTACLQFQSVKHINKEDLREGDLVFFRVGTSRISHVGVYLRNNFFVHSASSKGVSIASLTSAYWSKYFAGGGRVME